MYLRKYNRGEQTREEYLIYVGCTIVQITADLLDCGATIEVVRGMVSIVMDEGKLGLTEKVLTLQVALSKAELVGDARLERVLDRLRP